MRGAGIMDLQHVLLQNGSQTDEGNNAPKFYNEEETLEGAKEELDMPDAIITYDRFINIQLPYIAIWTMRLCSVVVCYQHHNVRSFVLLNWLLLSFILNEITFINLTTYLVMPLYVVLYLFTFFINIPFPFLTAFHQTPFFLTSGFEFVYPSFETFMFFVVSALMVLMIPLKNVIRLMRVDIRDTFFKKCTHPNMGTLWRMIFYFIKRIHIFVLVLIFVLAIANITFFTLGLMFFFAVFCSSTPTYRQSGKVMIYFTAFFIWVQYLTSLISRSSNITTALDVMDFSGADEEELAELSETGIN
mmetsp:Transcript_33905/g.33008  ORF Transcript_33905/g.33008 Transcript_33905/m.33008 type:complete len:302 (+) Transcript_33905:166-1071(+)